MDALTTHAQRLAALRAYVPQLMAAHPAPAALLRAFDTHAMVMMSAARDDEQRHFVCRGIQLIRADYGIGTDPSNGHSSATKA